MNILIRLALAAGGLWLLSRIFQRGAAAVVKLELARIRAAADTARNAGLPGVVVRAQVGPGGAVTYQANASAELGEVVFLEVVTPEGIVAVNEGEELRSAAVPLAFLEAASGRQAEALAALGAPLAEAGGRLEIV